MGFGVKRKLGVLVVAALAMQLSVAVVGAQQAPAANNGGAGQSALQKSIEAYLRNLYAFGADTQVKVSPPKEMGADGILAVDIEVKVADGTQTGKVYVTKDGKFLIRGEVSELGKDPLAEARAQLDTKDAPAMGDPKAAVTLVEFSDFQCPVCRRLHDALRELLPNYPQVRVIFKDYPLETIHPWARTGAMAGRCAYQQDPKAFWKMYDLIYDNQDLITPETAWNKVTDFAGQAGLNVDTFKACMSSPEAGAAIDASRSNGQLLEVSSTPTVFINGRRIVGVDPRLIEQYIRYELEQHKVQNAAAKN
jgi:protein-disulfide isomerase